MSDISRTDLKVLAAVGASDPAGLTPKGVKVICQELLDLLSD